MRQIYQDRYDVEMSPAFLLQLSLILFKKRRQPTPFEEAETGAEDDAPYASMEETWLAGAEDDAAYASMEETWLAIRDVLADRYEYLQYEGIDDIHHLMDQRQRAEMVTYVRDKFASSLEQRKLQERDKGTAKGWEATGKGKGRDTVNKFVRQKIRSRWHRHLQIKYGTKELWEVLAFTGDFNVDWLTSERMEILMADIRALGRLPRRRPGLGEEYDLANRLHSARYRNLLSASQLAELAQLEGSHYPTEVLVEDTGEELAKADTHKLTKEFTPNELRDVGGPQPIGGAAFFDLSSENPAAPVPDVPNKECLQKWSTTKKL